jgi:hypothetical protein
VTRYCDKSPTVPPPSLYFAFGDALELHTELTTTEPSIPPPVLLHHQSSSISTDDNNADTTKDSDYSHSKSDSSVSSLSEYDEKLIEVDSYESQPGTIYADIDKNQASFIVASNPLTKTHTWHPMPKNSIMWYTRGSLPELRLLRTSSSTLQHVQ